MTPLDYSTSTDFRIVLSVLILISRLGDVLSTYLVTPSLKLEGNPIARKLGWKFVVLTIAVAMVPFFSAAVGLIVLVPSLLVSASNITKIFAVRTIGEAEYYAFMMKVISRGKLSNAITGVLVSSIFLALAGAVLLYLSPDPNRYWSYWFAIGMLTYSFATALYGSLYYRRLFKLAQKNSTASGSLEGSLN